MSVKIYNSALGTRLPKAGFPVVQHTYHGISGHSTSLLQHLKLLLRGILGFCHVCKLLLAYEGFLPCSVNDASVTRLMVCGRAILWARANNLGPII